jgi:ribonuclease BN (tRNA processing enzyme)/ActR/RegA family two-component response regulator
MKLKISKKIKMNKKLNFYIVESDQNFLKMMKETLEENGHKVKINISPTNILSEISEEKPDVIILDIITPRTDILEFCKKLRHSKKLNSLKIIITSPKHYEYDKRSAFYYGADGYIQKPILKEEFLKKINEIVYSSIILTFWGIRGTLPVPGKKTLKYGGNTSCVSIFFPKEKFFIFDAGSGIKELSNYLISTIKDKIKINIFISHPHWDHTDCLSFFEPLYIRGNEIQICGPSQGEIKMRQVISQQMEGIYFPITLKEFSARVYFKDLTEDFYEIDEIPVQTKLLTHPGYDLGYRIEYKGKKICYVTDNELYPKNSKYYSQDSRNKLIDFVKDSDILIHECTYFDEEYKKRINWGHSSVSEVAELAYNANVKNLYIFHHDPSHIDSDIEKKLELINKFLEKKNSRTKCFAPKEQERIELRLEK